MSFIGTEHTYIKNLLTGAALDVENTVEVSVKPNSKSIDIISRSPETVGNAIRQVMRREPQDFSLVIDAFSPKLFALQMMGTVSGVSKAEDTIVDEVHYPRREEGLLLENEHIADVVIDCENATGGSGFLINGALAVGATVLTVDGTATSGDVAVGDIIALGSASGYKYRVTAVNITGTHPTKSGTITIADGLVQAVADDATITHVAAYTEANGDFTMSALQGNAGFIQFTDKVANSDMEQGLGSVKVSYTAKAMTYKNVVGGTLASIPLYIRGRVYNESEDSNGLLTIYKARVMPSEKFDWAADSPQQIKLDGKLEIVTGKIEPYSYKADVVYAA